MSTGSIVRIVAVLITVAMGVHVIKVRDALWRRPYIWWIPRIASEYPNRIAPPFAVGWPGLRLCLQRRTEWLSTEHRNDFVCRCRHGFLESFQE